MVQIDSAYVVRTLQQLVRIESINPSIAVDGSGEAAIAAYIAGALSQLSLDVSTHEYQPGRTSVTGMLKGSGGGRSLMLNAHIDTVGVEGMPEPFSGDVRDGRLYGRGGYDMKGGMAACMGAAKAIVDAGVTLAGDLLVTGVADEEHASLGMQDLIARAAASGGQVDAAIVTEPTELEICLAHKGFVWIEVEVRGRAAHGSRVELGIDANMRMGRVLGALDRLEQALRRRSPHALLGTPSLHAATLHGGVGLSTYAPRCVLQIERRTVPGETETQVVGEVSGILDELRAADPSFDATLTVLLSRDPFEVAPDAAIVRTLTDATTTVLGRRPAHVGQMPWMDAAFLSAAGVETVVMGASGTGAHAKEEWVDVQSVVDLAQSLALAAVAYCGTSSVRS